MKKLKKRQAAAKRYHKTATGKIRRRRAYKGHLLTKKSATRKHKLEKLLTVRYSEEKLIKKII
uniref:50S ribosomal protein L35 n=1 Tax=Eustigmatophyceae sp. Ndem 8/9T-3m6.8 TaxID=2506146 RepID=A0A410D2D3_9STRA|nr:ribosomal protein L35 [Eustigmatophyceae sp. Ndem 8/9T-3m6.8]QAA11884.1 ribosomal protein L35 [Eustigmatophyceae sp. Ndem 8/9T-3m6.8]